MLNEVILFLLHLLSDASSRCKSVLNSSTFGDSLKDQEQGDLKKKHVENLQEWIQNIWMCEIHINAHKKGSNVKELLIK